MQSRLHEVLVAARVVEVNASKRSQPLDYDQGGEHGVTVIAVGGFSLSRGLTLEGLTVSYFLRNSMMYDTLMQMGRWFGYRPGYEDLCRVWMPADGVGWYAHIHEAMDDLQAQLKRMELAKATPEQFGLAVRSHPESLIVTARNKMGTGREFPMKVGLAGKLVETTRIRIGPRTAGPEPKGRAKLWCSHESSACGGHPFKGTLYICSVPCRSRSAISCACSAPMPPIP